MSRPEYLSVRLIVWEGNLGDPQAQLKAYTGQLKNSINMSLETTKWKYSRWKTYPAGPAAKHKLEIHIRHPKIVDPRARNNAIHNLCGKLLQSDLATRLRLENPAVPFAFCPSKEGEASLIDNLFARCFSVAVVTQYCVDGTQSEEMEKAKADFVNRNCIKYIQFPMLGFYNLASLAELYERQILVIIACVEKKNGVVGIAGNLSGLRETVGKLRANLGGDKPTGTEMVRFQQTHASSKSFACANEATVEEQLLRLSVAIAVQLSRTFVAYAPDIKEKLKPMLEVLNEVTIKARLALASQAYIDTATAPIAALNRLQGQENATTNDIAATINSFGSLMQSTLPLFDATLTISDAEFANLTGLSMVGGVGLAGLGGGGAWLWCAGASAGPVGLLFAGGVTAVAAGAFAIAEGRKWVGKQKVNPSDVLLGIQKTVEECCRFLLGLSFMLAEEEEAAAGEKQQEGDGGKSSQHLEKIQRLREQLGDNKDFAKPGYMRAYYRIVSRKLEHDMKDLAAGLRLHGVEVTIN